VVRAGRNLSIADFDEWCAVLSQGVAVSGEKELEGEKPGLANQARAMQRNLHGGIIIDYAPHGYTACDIAAVID